MVCVDLGHPDWRDDIDRYRRKSGDASVPSIFTANATPIVRRWPFSQPSGSRATLAEGITDYAIGSAEEAHSNTFSDT